MNVFFLDRDPHYAAEMQCDKHVTKMIVESAQLLCSKYHEQNISTEDLINNPNNVKLYRKTHFNHPSAIWCRQTTSNWEWLLEHTLALLNEYTYRYDKLHLSRHVVKLCEDNMCMLKFDSHGLSEIPQCFGDKFDLCTNEDPVIAYRTYYLHKQDDMKMVWTRRHQPSWWKNEAHNIP